MSQMRKNVIKLVALVFAAAVVVGITEVTVEAAPGQVRFTVNFPPDGTAQCIEDIGTALAVVSGGKAGFPGIPVLLVTSCVSGTQINLFLLNPLLDSPPNPDGSFNAARVNTISTAIPTTNAPTFGWEALVLRADKGDLLACGTNTAGQTVLWLVDFSPLNTTPDGTATFFGNGPPGSSCNAIAWDASNKTIYQTPAVGANVFHFTETGTTPTSITSIPSGCATPISGTLISGLGVAGTSLFVGCEANGESSPSQIRQVYKVDGTPVRPNAALIVPALPGPSFDPIGLPDDPTTLATEYKELLWTLNTSSAQFMAVEIPGGTLGQRDGVPVLFPGVGDPSLATSCQPNATGAYVSSAGDALLDCWKNGAFWSDGLPGISYNGNYNGDTRNRDVALCVGDTSTTQAKNANCAVSTSQKDLFLELDYMGTFHKPDQGTVITPVVQAFANAPTPIRLHVLVDDLMPHSTTTAFVPCTVAAASGEADFDSLKAQFFGTLAERNAVNLNGRKDGPNAKALVFRYGLIVHNLAPTSPLNTSSGCSEIGGNDFVVSLGSWGRVLQPDGTYHQAGSPDEQTGTLMHEYGHTLGLRHGGGENINCKPNYPSVMSYTLQTSKWVPARPLDYSRLELGFPQTGGVIGLNKTQLNEPLGVGVYIGTIGYGPVPAGSPTLTNASGAINWDKSSSGAVNTGVNRDINQITNSSGGCPALQDQRGLPGNAQTQAVILKGFKDWDHLQFNHRASVDLSDGARAGVDPDQPPELAYNTVIDHSFTIIDIKPNDPNNTISRNDSPTIGVAIFSLRDDSVDPITGAPHPQVVFDATDIDPSTLLLEGTDGATWVISVNKNPNGKFQCSTSDVDHDGLQDLVCSFKIPRGTLSSGETRALLEGKTFHAQSILGSDFIRVVP